MNKTCAVCGGLGGIPVTGNKGDRYMSSCVACKGNGRVRDPNLSCATLRCLVCNGTGEIESAAFADGRTEQEECPECHGLHCDDGGLHTHDGRFIRLCPGCPNCTGYGDGHAPWCARGLPNGECNCGYKPPDVGSVR